MNDIDVANLYEDIENHAHYNSNIICESILKLGTLNFKLRQSITKI